MLATIKFRPIERETLRILFSVHEAEARDPTETYSRLLSAAMVAGAILGLAPEQIAQQAQAFAEGAQRAVSERPDIFGSSPEAH